MHPDYWGQGIGTKLIYWAEKQAQSLSSYAPNGVKTVLQVNLFSTQYEAIDLFTQSAYSKVREWMHLVIDLEKPPILPPLDKDYYIREMNLEDDWEIVAPAMDEAYADHWGILSLPEDYSTNSEEQENASEEMLEDESYSNAQGFCFIVMDNDVVAGGILCNAKIPERDDTGRVGSLFVRPQYRRQGIGRALMLQAFDAFWQAGIHRIVNDTDAESFTEAPTFYTSLGMRQYRREYLYEKTIRDGKEIRRLSV